MWFPSLDEFEKLVISFQVKSCDFQRKIEFIWSWQIWEIANKQCSVLYQRIPEILLDLERGQSKARDTHRMACVYSHRKSGKEDFILHSLRKIKRLTKATRPLHVKSS